MEPTLELINKMYDDLAKCKEYLFDAAQTLSDAKFGLETKKLELVSAGLIVGKNETERNAKTQELCSEELEAYQAAQDYYDEKRHEYELMELQIEKLRLMVRLIEITKEKE